MARRKSLLSREAKAAIAAANWQKKQAKLIYKTKIKEMRPFLKKLKNIDLREELTAAQKGFVTKAWKEYSALTLRPTKIYRSKKKSNLDLAQKASQHSGKVKFDVAFVPTVNNTAKVIIKNGNMIVRSKYIDEIKILFNMTALITNPEKELARVLAKNPEYSQFVLMAGEYIWNGGISRSKTQERVLQQLMRYAPGGEGFEKRGPNSFYGNWAFGLKGFKAKDQLDIEQYLSAYNKASKGKRVDARKIRRKRGNTYGTKF